MLEVDFCMMQDTRAAFAAIAALPELASLKLSHLYVNGMPDSAELGDLQQVSKLTKLCLQSGEHSAVWQHLSQLSVLLNLEDLELSVPPFHGAPGGFPPELKKLTALKIDYSTGQNAAEQLQHLSILTALQDLELCFADYNDFHVGKTLQPGDLAGMSYLSQMTRLKLSSHSHALRTDSSYVCMGPSDSLAKACAESMWCEARGPCRVHPAAVAGFLCSYITHRAAACIVQAAAANSAPLWP